MKTAKELMALKDKIEQNKTERSKLEGKLSALFDILGNDYGCMTIADAKTALKTLQAGAKKSDASIGLDIKNLEESYGL